jgi:hypothetical protein
VNLLRRLDAMLPTADWAMPGGGDVRTHWAKLRCGGNTHLGFNEILHNSIGAEPYANKPLCGGCPGFGAEVAPEDATVTCADCWAVLVKMVSVKIGKIGEAHVAA